MPSDLEDARYPVLNDGMSYKEKRFSLPEILLIISYQTQYLLTSP